jgi:signal peptidase II
VRASPRSVTSRASRGTVVMVAVALAVIAVDQLTKVWAVNALDDHDIDVVWTLRFHLTFNGGMAFSQGRGLGPVIGVVAIVVVAVLLISLRRTGSTVASVAVGLVVGGAAGNILDRIFRSGDGFLTGEVVDFIDFQWWPVFNVADAAVVIGGILLLLSTALVPEPRSR